MRVNLQIVRGLASLAVFLFHTRSLLHENFPVLERLAQFGDLGVPLFFVISGYVITASANATLRNNGHEAQFLKRRFLRIFPPFWFSIVVIVSLPYFLEAISVLKTGRYTWPSPRFQSLNLQEWLQILSLTKIFANGGTGLYAEFENINIVYWTLAIEFQFYLVMYFAIFAKKHFIAVLILTTLASLWAIVNSDIINGGVFLHFWPMFALGIALWYLLDRQIVIERVCRNPSSISLVVILPITGLTGWLAYVGDLRSVLSAVLYSDDFGFALICFVLIWASTPLERQLAAITKSSNPVLRYPVLAGWILGEISYSLYLLHTQIAAVPSMAARQFFAYGDVPYVATVLFGTILLCYVFYLCCERPFVNGGKQVPVAAPAHNPA